MGERSMIDVAEFRKSGFLIVPDLLAPEELAPLREAAARLVARCRSGEHRNVRLSPSREDSWGAGSMFAPTALEPALIDAMAGERVRAISEEILGPARLAVVSFLYNPERENWDGVWHRDSQFLFMNEPERRRALNQGLSACVQWNVALYDDACLMVVPGSLGRDNTPEEQAVLDGGGGEMPGAITVALPAGTGLVYDPFQIHRGLYRANAPRATLHFSCHPAAGDTRLPDSPLDIPKEAANALSARARSFLAI
jgi:hypothetical protein